MPVPGYLNETTVIAESAEISANGNSGNGVDVTGYEGVISFVQQAVPTSGTNTGLVVALQHSDEEDANFENVGNDYKFANIANSAATETIKAPVRALKKYVRVVDVLTGSSSPKATRAVAAVGTKKY